MKCPGQDTQYWNEDAIFETECPKCGHPMEFFKDDATRRCPGCREKIVNPKMDFGCASYCKFAEQCLGTLPEEFVAQREDMFKDRVAVEMKKYFGTDFKRIGHASKVANYAEKIGKKEKASLPVILCASYLYEIGARSAVEKYGSDDPDKVEKENPIIAGQLMEKLGARKELIREVVDIIENKNRIGIGENLNHKVVHDADMLARMAACDGKQGLDDETLIQKIESVFLTGAGIKLARQVLLETA